jgi:NAD dependent epimerase/dehydratase family enzyme
MSILPLMSSNTVAQKVLDTGYQFKYVDLDEALKEIYR